MASESPPLQERDDDVLMALVAMDSRPAYEALAARHLAGLARFCAKFVGSAREGEELALDALLEAWTQRQAYRPRGQFRTWLFTLARNRCLNHVRGERRRRRWVEPERDGGAAGQQAPGGVLAPDQIDRLLAAERAHRVRDAILELTPKLREAVLLRFDQELDYAEMARIVGAPEVTVRSRVFLAVRQLRQALARGEVEP